MITSIEQLDFSKNYTYADYLTWKFQERVELIAGPIFRMSQGPSRRHQRISFEISRQLANHLLNQKCEAFAAPFDVRLVEDSTTGDAQIINTVQPDLCVICDPSKLDEKGCFGAPDFIIEILSPSSATRDIKHKFDLYQRFKVKEYWVLDPYSQTVQMNVLEKNGKYKSLRPYIYDKPVASTSIKGFSLDPSTIFDNDPDESSILKEVEAYYQKRTPIS